MHYSRIAALAFAALSLVHGQSGHWEGAIELPNGKMDIIVDLSKNAKGEWMGTISVPSQNAKGVPLEAIVVRESKVGFTIKGAPGHQTFEGSAAADGKTLSGTFSSAGQSVPFKLARTGEAKFEPPPKSSPIAKDLEGDWEGALEANGNVLRLKLHLANGADGATGSIVSVDQGGGEISIGTITQKESNLKLEVQMISAVYDGDVSADRSQIVGHWKQGGGTLPLTFRRPAK